jgi:hypothetical protein
MSKYKAAKSGSKKGNTSGELSIPSVITGIWAGLILTFFPVFVTRFYFNILETKYMTYCIVTGTMIGSLLIWGLLTKKMQSYHRTAKLLRSEMGFAGWFNRTFDLTDKCVMLFYLISFISTFTAYPYIEQALTGIEGRHTGLILLTLYCGAYFCGSRFIKFHQRFVTMFLWFAMFVCVFGITDYYKMNILGFKDRIRVSQMSMFTSTIGNINTYTTFVGFVIAISGTLFILSKEKISRVLFYFVCLAIAFQAMAMGNSDNGYLTLGAFFAFVPFVAFRSRQGIRRYCAVLTLFLADILYVKHVDDTLKSAVIGINGLFDVISQMKLLPALTIALFVITVTLYVYDFKSGSADKPAANAVGITWKVLVAAAAAGLIFLIVKANLMTMDQAKAQFGGLAIYLKFSENWGTNRGAVWIAAVKDYSQLSPVHKIFGTGPDTFGIYMMHMSYEYLVEKTRQIYDSAHNEYLQYLFTIGPIGLTAYLGFLISSVRNMFRKAAVIEGMREANEKDSFDVKNVDSKYGPYLNAFAMLVICYACQAVVNINLPISTPIMWAFVTIACSVGHRKAPEPEDIPVKAVK